MPYARETAGKGGHSDFIKNPDVMAFLSHCTFLRQPSEEEAKNIARLYHVAPTTKPPSLPLFVLASDASKSDTPISDKLPSTQVGFLKVSHVLIDMEHYQTLLDPKERFVSPFKVAELHRSATPVTFTMPGSNVRYKQNPSVKGGFRQSLYDQLSANRTRQGAGLTLAEVLIELDSGTVRLQACSACQDPTAISFTKSNQIVACSACGSDVYVTDALRLHEGISDFGDNASAMTRMMNAIEHLMIAAFILELWNQEPLKLTELAFVLDGPLAVFGEPAKLSQRLQKLIYNVNRWLSKQNKNPMLVLGLQKTGGLMDHAKLLDRFLPAGVLKVVDDAYRNTYITGADAPAANFGNETYYGQDFIFKTEGGSIFNFAIPYPFEDKALGPDGTPFAARKVDLAAYGTLITQACDLIRHFEMDLYESAIVPVALAHRHASISLVPGGKVLDLMVRTSIK